VDSVSPNEKKKTEGRNIYGVERSQVAVAAPCPLVEVCLKEGRVLGSEKGKVSGCGIPKKACKLIQTPNAQKTEHNTIVFIIVEFFHEIVRRLTSRYYGYIPGNTLCPNYTDQQVIAV
jgi:hypothetical protein